jgi:membrane-associated phospholipid phosphatase
MTTVATAARPRRLAVALAVLACAFAGLTGWVLARHGHPLSGDLSVHADALQHRTAALTGAAAALSVSAEVLAYAVAALGGRLALRSRPWWLGAPLGAAALAVGQLLRDGLSVAIGRARPPAADWARPASGYGFPSGHTTTATLAAGLLCLGLLRALRRTWRVAVICVAACWAGAVGASRVYLGVHWPTDVLGGWLLGTLLTALAAPAFFRLAAGRSGPLGAQRAEQQHERGQL